MGKINKIPIFPIFLTVFSRVVFVFSIPLQLETNYLKTNLTTTTWQTTNLKPGLENS